MKKLFEIRLIVFYICLGLAHSILWVIHDLSNFPFTFFEAVLNNIWRAIYIIVINYLFFEYTIPFVTRKRDYIIYNIFLGFPVLFFYCIVWSYGLYSWRKLGVVIHIYTPFISKDASVIEAQMGYSVGSVFFFGIIR